MSKSDTKWQSDCVEARVHEGSILLVPAVTFWLSLLIVVIATIVIAAVPLFFATGEVSPYIPFIFASPLVVFFVVASGFDVVLSKRRLGSLTIDPVRTSLTVFSPDRIVVDVDVPPGRGRKVIASPLSLSDSPAQLQILSNDGGTIPIVFSDGHPTSTPILVWIVSAEALGLFKSIRIDCFVLDEHAHRGPERSDRRSTTDPTDREIFDHWGGSTPCVVVDLGQDRSVLETTDGWDAVNRALCTTAYLAGKIIEDGRSVRLITAELSSDWDEGLAANIQLMIHSPRSVKQQARRLGSKSELSSFDSPIETVGKDSEVANLSTLASRLAQADFGFVERPDIPYLLISPAGLTCRDADT